MNNMRFIILSVSLCGALSVLSEARQSYDLVGCYKDKILPRKRAIPYSGKTFDGISAVQECAEFAAARGYDMFAVQYGGECYTGPEALQTFDKYGRAKDDDCQDGLGGRRRNSVYTVAPLLCGKRETTRIVGGQGTRIENWPWQAMLETADSDSEQFCGGSLLNNEWVVTAAHCVHGEQASDMRIRLGARYRTKNTPGTQQKFDLAKIIIHPKYDGDPDNGSDLALLKLADRAVFSKAVRPVCLPDKRWRLPFNEFKHPKCWITGWGSLREDGKQPDVLQQAPIPLVSWGKCAKWSPLPILDSHLCAGRNMGGVDACQGDSGGPLVCEHRGKWYLEGVTSTGFGCGEPLLYGIYANVRHLQLWLEETMKTN